MSMNPATRAQAGVRKAEIKYIIKHTNLTYQQVVDVITNILDHTLAATMKDLKAWINKYVPKRTGQLRDSLKKNLESSRVVNGIMRIKLGTHLNYAPAVNLFSTSQVRHRGEIGYAYYYGHYGRIVLNDPLAIGSFWDKILLYITQRARTNLIAAKRVYLGFQSGHKVISGQVKA